MFTVLVCAAIGFALSLPTWWDRACDFADKLSASVIVTAAFAFLGYAAASMIGASTPVIPKKQEFALVAMRSDEGYPVFLSVTSGEYGTVYTVLVLQPDGTFRHRTFYPSFTTSVLEDDDLEAGGLLTETRMVPDPDWSWRNWAVFDDQTFARQVEIRLPRGSVRGTLR